MLNLRKTVAFVSASALVGLTPLKGWADIRTRPIFDGTMTLRCDNDSQSSTATWFFSVDSEDALATGYNLTLTYGDGTYANFSEIFPDDPRDFDLDSFTSSRVQGRVTLTGRISHLSGAITDFNSAPLSTFCS